MSSGLVWERTPGQLAGDIAAWGERVLTAVMAVAEYIARQAQNDMRTNAVWTDRTGNARSGLFSVAQQAAADLVEIYLSHGHTIDYGVNLELGHGGKYAIVGPTMERLIPEIKRMLDRIFA